MNNFLKIGIATLAITAIGFTACKKSDLQLVDKAATNQFDEKAMASKLAVDFYKSFSPSGNASLKTNSRLGVMAGSQCGDVTYTPYNQTYMKGDTSVTAKGKSIFTLTCSGSNGPDGYLFSDTTYTTESGKGFTNSFQNFQKYTVKNLPNANAYNIQGNIVAWARFAINGNEQHDFATTYDINGGGAVAAKDNPGTLVGLVDFRCTHTHIYQSAPQNNLSIRYAGFMDIQKDVINSYFYVEGETYFMKYVLDRVTGNVLSGPAKAYYDRK